MAALKPIRRGPVDAQRAPAAAAPATASADADAAAAGAEADEDDETPFDQSNTSAGIRYPWVPQWPCNGEDRPEADWENLLQLSDVCPWIPNPSYRRGQSPIIAHQAVRANGPRYPILDASRCVAVGEYGQAGRGMYLNCDPAELQDRGVLAEFRGPLKRKADFVTNKVYVHASANRDDDMFLEYDHAWSTVLDDNGNPVLLYDVPELQSRYMTSHIFNDLLYPENNVLEIVVFPEVPGRVFVQFRAGVNVADLARGQQLGLSYQSHFWMLVHGVPRDMVIAGYHGWMQHARPYLYHAAMGAAQPGIPMRMDVYQLEDWRQANHRAARDKCDGAKRQPDGKRKCKVPWCHNDAGRGCSHEDEDGGFCWMHCPGRYLVHARCRVASHNKPPSQSGFAVERRRAFAAAQRDDHGAGGGAGAGAGAGLGSRGGADAVDGGGDDAADHGSGGATKAAQKPPARCVTPATRGRAIRARGTPGTGDGHPARKRPAVPRDVSAPSPPALDDAADRPPGPSGQSASLYERQVDKELAMATARLQVAERDIVAQARADLGTAMAKVATLKAENKALKGDITSIARAEAVKWQKKVRELEKEVESRPARIAALEKENGALRDQVKTLEGRIAGLQDALDRALATGHRR